MDGDTHYCLNCHLTINGLDNYVAHRREHCLRITRSTKPAASASPVSGLMSHTNTATTAGSSLSPTQLSSTVVAAVSTSAAVEAAVQIPSAATTATSAAPTVEESGMILYDPPASSSAPTTEESAAPLDTYDNAKSQEPQDAEGDGGGGGGRIEDFLSSLELQVRANKEKQNGEAEGKVLDDKLKTLNILNDLEFSSDSDDLPSDVDDLLDYANAEDEHSAYRRVPRGGKWGPSGKQLAAAGKGKSKHSPGKSGKHPRTYGGKGSKLRSHSKHSIGKSVEMKDRDKAGEESEEEEPPKPETKLECKTCSRTFSGQHSYDRHLKSRFHKQNLNPKPKKKVVVKQEIECPVCDKVFNTKYNFARHLASTYHTRREAGSEPMVLDENIQYLLLKQSPVQCLVCSFYCNNMAVMLEHMKTEEHVEKCSRLSGPLICLCCKLKVYSNDALLQHFNSPEHVESIKATERPCVVKEVRCNVQCQVCHKDFHSASRLEQHLKEYHQKEQENNPLKRPPKQRGVRYKMACPFCSKEWNSTFQLNIHIRRRHSKEKPFPCKSCGVAFTDEASLKSHEATKKHINQQVLVGWMTEQEADEATTKSPLKVKAEKSETSSTCRNVCQECDFTCNLYGELKGHYQSEHPDKMIICKPCNFGTFLEKQYERHVNTATHVKRQAAYEEKTEDEISEFLCDVCFAVFSTKEALDIHAFSHNTIVSEKQLRDANDGDPLVGVHPRFHEFWRTSCQNLSKQEKIRCVECSTLVGAQNIIAHFRKHSNSCPFRCTKCPLKFSSASSLRRHMQVIHLNIKIHQCSLCEERFNRRSYLLTHLLRAHKDSAEVDCPHVCTQCDKRFPLKHMLSAHEIQHSSVKPYACDFEGCSQEYKSKSELQMHRRNHTGERPFVCEFCGYSTTGRQKLTRHLRTHTQERNYSCQYCSYEAQNSSHLHRHMRIHIGNKPYKCPYCAHTCNTHENIRKHILKTKRHKGLPCYPCQLCDFGTNFVKEFGEHLERSHNQKLDPKGVLSVIAGLFNKADDPKDIPEGSCALPVREKATKVSVLKANKVSSQERRKTGMQNVILQRHLIQSVMKIENETPAATTADSPQIQIISLQSGEQQTIEMIEYGEQEIEMTTSYETNDPDLLRQEGIESYETVQQQQQQQQAQLRHGDSSTAQGESTEMVTYQTQHTPQIVHFNDGGQEVEAISMIPYHAEAVVGGGGGGDDVVQVYQQEGGGGPQQYQLVYTDDGTGNHHHHHHHPQQQQQSMMSVSEHLVLEQGHAAATVDNIKQAMEEINAAGGDQNMQAIEVNEAALLQLGDGKVEWVTEDGSVIMNDATATRSGVTMEDSTEGVVVMDTTTATAAATTAAAAQSEQIVMDHSSTSQQQQQMYNKLEVVVYDGKSEEAEVGGGRRDVVVGTQGDLFQQSVIHVQPDEAMECKEETEMQ